MKWSILVQISLTVVSIIVRHNKLLDWQPRDGMEHLWQDR